MDYINENFVTLGDLDDIDDKITELSARRKAVDEQIALKSSNSPELSSEEISPHVTTLIHQIADLYPNTALSLEVDELIKKHGEISILQKLRSMSHKRQELVNQAAALDKALSTEQQITSLTEESTVDSFCKISKEISDAGFDEDIHSKLRQQFEDRLQRKHLSLASSLSQILTEIEWLSPKAAVSITPSDLKSIIHLFQDLADLQASWCIPQYPQVWWNLETLLRPFIVRFNFHFRDASKTNKLSKPEWALNYAETFLKDNMSTLELIIGQTFKKFQRIGVFEVITTVLVPVREKIKASVKLINTKIAECQDDEKALDQYGRLLSHLIFETTSFDQRLRNTFKFNPYISDLNVPPQEKWMGLAGDILTSRNNENEAVSNWLSLELRLAKKRFETEIISPANAFEVDYEFSASSDSPQTILRPTYSAYGLVKLFDNLTSHFRTINIVKYQLQYVSEIQMVFLDEYMRQLNIQFQQFNESLSSKFISNFIPGSVKADTKSATQAIVTNGLKGLEMLTGIYCSAKFVLEKMEEWSVSWIFIQLWKHYESSAEPTEESIFDQTIKEYESFLHKVLSKYAAFFSKEIRGALKEYVNTSEWNIEDTQHKNQVSPSLSSFTSTFPAYIAYLKRTLPEIDFYLISSKICDSYATVIIEYVITNNQFNKNGVEQLQTDLDYLHGLFSDSLLLDHSHKFSNAENKNYKRVFQSIEVLSQINASEARLLKKQFNNGEGVRSRFENRLDCLSDSECHDLLFRII